MTRVFFFMQIKRRILIMRCEYGRISDERILLNMHARERYRVTETTAGIPGGMYRKLEDSHGCFQGEG